MNNELSKDINAFLFDRSRREHIFEVGSYIHSLLKSHYDDDTDFLYHLHEFENPRPQRVGEKAEYAGIISYKHATLFDPAFCMRSWIKESPDRGALVKSVPEKITTEIGRIVDGKSVEVTPVAETSSRDDREYFLKYRANKEAYQAFFAGQTTVVYDPHFTLCNPSTADYVRMINDEQGFITDKAQSYVTNKANIINNRLWELDVIRERLAELLSKPGEHHVRRVIVDSIDCDMKMVNVHIEKDGQNGVFKVQAHSVVREAKDNSYISTYSLDAPSKRQFEKMFGRLGVLRFPDITRITYGKKVLYERKDDDSNDE